MSEIKRVKIDSILESQIPEFLNEESPLFKEFLKQYYYSLEHQSGTLDLANNLKKYKNIEEFNNETLIKNTNLTASVLAFDTVINVDSTIGWPDSYGLLKIDDEIITYLSKTNNSFVDCIRGFSGIDNIVSNQNVEFLDFTSTSAEEHLITSKVNNLSNLFLIEFFEKYRFEFFPGFETREFLSELSLPNILTGAKDFYSSKGTDSSYKLLFKILYGKDIEIIKPQDNTLVPSSNVYFITKNILVEKISGVGNPTDLPGSFISQTLPGIGTVSASIFNVEYRPVDNKELYEISLDSTSLDGTFQVSGKTKIMEDVEISSNNILVDSTLGFSDQGILIIKTETSDLIKINYQDKTVNQFLGVTGVDIPIPFGTDIIEEKFATSFVGSGNTSQINFRVINVIDNIDSSKTSNMRVGDTVRLSGFGKDLSKKVKFNSFIYNIPTKHQIKEIVRINSNLYRVTLFDQINVYLNETITLVDENKNKINALVISIEYPSIQSKKTSNIFVIQVQENLFNVNKATIISKYINKSKHITNYFPNLNQISTGIQNTYISTDDYSMFVASTGFPNYTIHATDNKKTVSTSGIGKTDLFYSVNHSYSTGESIYYKANGNSGISTGSYQVTKINANSFKLSFSKSDIFSKKYIKANSGILNDEVVKFGYQNKTTKNQKLFKKINLIPTPLAEYDDENRRTTSGVSKQIGVLVNGVELFSPTIFDESIYYGKLNSIECIDPGSGYDVINPPDLQINDFSGLGVKAKLNISGNVKKVKILSPGVGYQDKPKITITGGNGTGCSLESNLVSAKIIGFLKGDVSINVVDNEITFDDNILFEDNEQLVYNSNNNANIPGIINQSKYFIGIVTGTDNTVKLYNNLEDCFSRTNEINISGISSGVHNFSTLTNKNTISQIYVIDPGKGYSNRSVRVPSVLSFDNNILGINTYDSYICAKNHGFHSGEIVQYSHTGSPVSGLSSQFDYYLDVISSDKFRLASAGIGGTLSDINLVNKRYVKLNSLGLGTHIFAYPPIQIKIESLSAIGSTTIIEPILKPIVLGSVENVFLEEGGVSFGSTDIVNFHRRPFVGLSSIKSEALLNPIIIDGSIVGIQIINKGLGYRKDADIIVEGPGKFADLEAVIENSSLVAVKIISGGIGYAKTDTICRLKNRGVGLELLGNVNEWKINQVVKSKNLISDSDDGLIYPNLNPSLGLQFINLYVPKQLRLQLFDNFTSNNTESGGILNHSPILGYAYDGNVIYGPYGYSTPLGGPIKRLTSGYISELNPNLQIRPPGFEIGYFIDDYKFIAAGDLDEYNGRFCITPEFPNGTYAYFSTISVNSSGSGQNVLSGTPIPTYPYVVGNKFKDVPISDNFLPKFNQNLDVFNTNLIRNTGPYYLNYATSGYDLIDSVSDDYKQELSVESVNSSSIDDVVIFNSGDNYQVGDFLLLDNQGTEGTSASIDVSRIKGREVSNFQSLNSLIENVELTIRSNNIIGKTSSPHEFLNNQPVLISGISTITSSNLEGIRFIRVNNKEVELTKNIPVIATTGISTIVVVKDISGFEANDFIGIGTEILQITKISKNGSYFNVNRITNTGIHTIGLDNVKLLPTKFEFLAEGKLSDYTFGNKTIFFNPKEDVGTGAAGTTRLITGLSTSSVVFSRNIPPRSIYIPGHKFFTGEKLVYNCGFGGTSLFVNNVGSGVSFKLENNQEVYAVNLGVDYVGISTIGFTSTTGIGSQFNSLEFRNLDQFFGTIGVAHSLTTTNPKIICTVDSNSISVTTNQNHGLTTNDSIKLNVEISDEEEVKIIYDFVNRKTAMKEVSFTNNEVSVGQNNIDISSYDGEIETGDKVVYIAQTPITGVSHYGIYYVIKDGFNKIKLSQYDPDYITLGLGAPIDTIDFTSAGGAIQKLYFINPPLTAFKGNRIKFDVSDTTLLDMELTFYSDAKLNKKIEVIGSSENGYFITREGISGNPNSYVYVDTANKNNFTTFYYTLVPTGSNDVGKSQISIDDSVVGHNVIRLIDHSLNDTFKVDVSNSKTFTFINNKNLTYAELQSLSTANIIYDTNSKTALGPISKLKINFKGRGYKKLPVVKNISSKLGADAVVKLISPTIGRIQSFSRVKNGFDYPTDPTLSPLLSVPSVVGIKNIRTIGSVSVIFGGKNYNTVPTLVVPQNLKIKLQAIALGGSLQSVKIVTNSTELSAPLEIISIRNSNGFEIDTITENNNLVTLELLNTELVNTSFGSTNFTFPFVIGDEIFIENCRLTASTNFANNFNSENYEYKFFPVVGVNTNNNTVTYSMSGIATGNYGTYDNTLNLGFVVNKKDMPIFKMNLIDDVNYFSTEIVSTDKFRAVVMEGGWDQKLNQLRLDAGNGELQVGDKLLGQTSKVNGVIEYFDTFVLNSSLGVSRDKVGNVDNSIGILNEFQQRISDNFYYQKFSYSIKGDIPYDIWREAVKSLVHPAGFKEFSDLVIYSEPQQFSYSNNNFKPQILDSKATLSINIDNEVSMYERYNFAKVYEEDSLKDGSVEKVYIADGLVLSPYILNKTNKVLEIDDISNQFDGISYQELDGRYADGSDLLLYNRAFIQEEVVGFITATYPGITTNLDWDREICKRDVGLVVDAISHDTKYNSNNKSVEAGLSYWSGTGTNYVAGEEIETISGFKYISQLSKYIINNVGVQTSYQLSTSFNISNLSYNNVTGVTTITTTAPHLLTVDSYVVLKNIVLSCNSGGGLSTAIFPNIGAGLDGNGPLSPKGFSYPVIGVGLGSTAVTFTINPGVSTISHTYVSGGTVQKAFINFSQQFEKTILKDELCSQVFNENCCADVQSAISNYVGIITTIIGIGTTAAPSEITFPSLTRGGSVVGLSTFKLKNKGTSLFKHTFNSQSTIIDVVNNKFIISNHNYQSGQKLIYEYDNSPIGVATTSYVSGITSSLIKVGNFDGTAIFENGYSVAITTSRIGISTTLVPVGPSFKTYPSVIGFGTTGINAEFNVLITYNVGTGTPIGTSIILNKGGRGFKVGDTVSIAGTYLGGVTPTNNLSFVVSKTAPTSISTQANISYTNIPSSDGSGSIFDVGRDANGFVAAVIVINGGVGYASTSIISIAGTYVGGTQNDVLRVSPTELGTKKLPKELYVLKLNDNEFRVAGLSTSIFLGLVGIGSGSHSLSYSNPDASVIITIDGIVQSALRRKSLHITLSQPISTGNTTTLSVSSGISSLAVNDIINIGNELMAIQSIGIPSSNNVQVERSYFDSISGIHTVGAACTVLTGNFKINGDTIYFTTPPYGKTGLVGLETGSNFGGRIFSRRFDASVPIDENVILDDISLQFTGLAATQFSLKSDGEPVEALYNDVNYASFSNNNPIILINNVFQEPVVKYDIEDENANKLIFTDGVPKAGKIVRVAITTGFGYQPLLVASAKAQVSVSGTISSIILAGAGGGYRQSPVVSISSTIGSGASITATVGLGGTITGFNIVNPGSGYTSTSIPKVVIGIPTGYTNLPLGYYNNLPGIGQQAKISVEVGMGSSIISFKFDDVGVAYKLGDVLTASGITTGPGLRTDILNITDFIYDNLSGISTITTDVTHNLNIDDDIRISGAAFTCGYDEVGIKTFSYNNITGICTVTTYSPHGLLKNGVDANETSNEVFLYNLPFTCAVQHAGVTTTIFPDGTAPYGRVFPVLSSVGLNTFTMNVGISTIIHTFQGWPEIGITTFSYYEVTGLSTATTSSNHQFQVGDKVTLSGLAFTCSAEHVGVSTHIFPDGTSPYGYTFTITGVTTNTFTFNAGISTIAHNYVSGGITKKVPTAQRVLRYTDYSTDNSYDFRVIGLGGTNQFTIVSSASTISHYYVQSGIVSFRSFEPFLLTVEEVQTDKFSGFYPGQFIKFDDISNQFNGFKKRFTLRAIISGQPQVVNLKTPIGSDLDITNNIFIYLNDVLQLPGQSYQFKGSRVIFNEAPNPGSLCVVLYYRGSSVDVEEIIPPSTLKSGDSIIIKENKNNPLDVDQFSRVIKNISNSDQFDTFTYDSVGISTDPTKERPLVWIKQTHDKIINGALSSKSRPDLKSNIRPHARAIKDINIDDAQIYVDNVYPIFNDVDGLTENLRDIIIVEDKIIESAIGQAQVSLSSSISNIDITFGGVGYQNVTSPTVFVSSSAISKKDYLFDWNSSVGISPSYQLNSISYGNVFVGVGLTQALVISPDGKTWQSSTIGLTTSSDLRSVISHQNNSEYIYVSVGSNATIIRSTGVGNSITAWSNILLKEERSIPGFGVISVVNSSYTGIFNDIVYSPSYNSYVAVGAAGSIFVGAGIGTTSFISKTSSTLLNLNSVAFSFNTSINSGYFVVVGNNGTILSSNSGQIWDTLSAFTTQNLNKVIYAEGRFVIVGNNGTVIKSLTQGEYQLIPTNIAANLVNINYNSGVYAALDNIGNLYYSLDLAKWDLRSTNQANVLKDLVFTDSFGDDGRYVIVGFGGTSIYAEPVLNRATATASVSGGIVTAINITNGGFGYSPSNIPQVLVESDTYNKELVQSFKVTGDHGIIVGVNTFITGTPGIGTTTPKIEFVLKSETYDNSTLGIGYSSLNVFGINNSQLQKGDYFVITDSNVTVGHAITGITTSLGGMSNYPASKVGTARSFIDGVYRVENVTTPILGIVTVTCNLAPSPFGNFVQVYKRGPNNSGINTGDFYGNYSWGKLFDYRNRILGNPKSFTANTDNGIIGLSSTPKIIRTRSLSSK